MMCSIVISQLSFEYHPIGKTLRVISPFTYCDDGEHVGAFTREVDGRYLISDRRDALVNMEARGISLTKKRLDEIQQLLLKEGAELNARGEVIAWATKKDVGAIAPNIIKADMLASTLSLDWYQPVQAEKFESMAIDYLYHTELRDAPSLRENVYGLSGHQVVVPITIKTDIPKYIFTSGVKHGGNWDSAYSLLEKLTGLKASSEGYNSRFVAIDSRAVGGQIQQLSLLFHESSQVLPFSKRETWVKGLTA